jgi:hypothetical protein
MNKLGLTLSIILLAAIGCSKQEKNPVVPSEDLNVRISKTPEFRELERIRDVTLRKLVQNRVSKNAFLKACLKTDPGEISAIIGFDRGEFNDLTEGLKSNSSLLIKNFPELEQIGKSSVKPGGIDGIESFIDRYDDIMAKLASVPEGIGKASARHVTCQYGQYTACLALAAYGAMASGGGVLLIYGAGSYLCLCSYCTGGWLGWACF